MRLSVDRIENGVAVCEDDDGKKYEICLKELPPGAGEGSVLARGRDGGYILDEAEKKTRAKRNFKLAESLFDE